MTKLFEEFTEFLAACPTPYHFCEYARSVLKSSGFTEILERAPPEEMPKKGFIIRSDRTLFAYKDNGHNGSVISSAHCDSPVFVLKPNHEDTEENMKKLRVSNYGGGTWHTWLDRPLKLVGMILHRTEKGVKRSLFDSCKPVAIIPSAAIHLRQSPDHPTFDLENHFCPLYGTSKSRNMMEYVSAEMGIKEEDVEYYDLRFIDVNKPVLMADNLIGAQQLDDMLCTFASFKAFMDSEPEDGYTSAVSIFDNEEIGSLTKNGANTRFITDCLTRICNDDEEEERFLKENSVLLSCDVNHATHPNWSDKLEENHPVRLGDGPSVTITSESNCMASNHVAYTILMKASTLSGVSIQLGAEKNLDGGGSTIGPMSEMHNGIPTVDIGCSVLGMHSIREMASIDDINGLTELVKYLYSHYSECRVIEE